jgi:hypothetical protein
MKNETTIKTDTDNYAIIGYNRAQAGTTQNKGYADALQTAETMNLGRLSDGSIIIVRGSLYWPQAKCKGVTLANGKNIIYGEYEREYFTEDQLSRLRGIMFDEQTGQEIVNGYKIVYSDFWKAYQVNHTTSDEIGQADFKTLKDAREYAING